jgi:hypothetical protein
MVTLPCAGRHADDLLKNVREAALFGESGRESEQLL